jgi:hypothetical protein
VRLQLTAAAAAVVVGAALLAPAAARADGWIGVRGAYYQERSTRVTQPMIDARFDTGPDGRVDAHLLVDSITSASAASGSTVQWTETRYEAGLGYSHLVGRLRLGVFGRFSTEPDYVSRFAMLRGELELFQRNTRIAFGAGRGIDDIDNGARLPHREDRLHTGLATVGVTQVLGPRLVASLTYDFIDLHGYQANMYRVVTGGAQPYDERVPRLRLRHAAAGALRGFVRATGTTWLAAYRFYADDWGIVGHTPEARITQDLLPGLDLRARYRFHTQTAADFWQAIYTEAELSDFSRWVTKDEKLSALTTHTVGGQVGATLALFGVAGSLAPARIDVGVERIWQSTSYGHAWVGQVGFSVPLEY